MASQLKILEIPNPFHLRHWKDIGKHLMAAQGVMLWDIGDWLLEGEEGGLKSDDLKDHAQKITGYPWGTLKNYMVVSRAIPKKNPDGSPSRRRDGLPYSIHREVAKFSPEHQEKLLQEAETKLYTVGKFRALIKDWQKPEFGRLPPDPSKPLVGGPAEKKALVKYSVPNALKAFLKAIHPQSSSDLTARLILYDYIQENRVALLALAAEHDPRWATIPKVPFLAIDGSGVLALRGDLLPRVIPDPKFLSTQKS